MPGAGSRLRTLGGKGYPDGLSGYEVPIALRVVSVARDAELWERRAGGPATVEVLAHRRGHGYDPAAVDVLIEGGRPWLDDLADFPHAAVFDAELAPASGADRARTSTSRTAQCRCPRSSSGIPRR